MKINTMLEPVEIKTLDEFKKLLRKARRKTCEIETKKFCVSFCETGSSYIDIENGGCYLREVRSTNLIIAILNHHNLLSFKK